MSQGCRSPLETALKREVSDSEYAQIVADFTKAQADAGKAYGKGFNSLPKEQRASLIANQLNVNRAKSLTSLETQLLSNAKIGDVSGDLKSTLGQSLDLIGAKELADNINNMVGSVMLTRTGFLNRGGSRLNLDVVYNTIKNNLARALLYDSPVLTQGIDEIITNVGFTKSFEAEDALAQKIMDDPSILKPIIDAINLNRSNNGLTANVAKLELSVARDDLATLWFNNGKNDSTAAKAFSDIVQPLLSDNKVNLEELYMNLIRNIDDLEGAVGVKNPISDLNNLNFKDGASYMAFVRGFGQNKDLVTTITSTIENTAMDVAKRVVFGTEDIGATIDAKIAMTSKVDAKGVRALEAAKRGYNQVTGGTTRNYNKTALDLGITTFTQWTSAIFLGISPIKGVATDSINVIGTSVGRGELGAGLGNQVDTIMSFGKGDRETFIVGADEFVNSTQHYLNTAGRGVLSNNVVVNALQRSSRFTKNLAAKVQALVGQNAIVKAKKRSLGRMAEHQLFQKDLKVELTDSLNPLTHAKIKRLGLNNLKDMYDLDINTYNSKLGKSVDAVEFAQAKNQMILEMEGAIMHQVQSLQIDSGGLSVSAQNARLFGDMNSGARRYIIPIVGQFLSYSQNYILKNSIVRGILTDPSLAGKIKYGIIMGVVIVASGYSNYNIGQAVRSGSKEPEFADPITDIQAWFDESNSKKDRKRARGRLLDNLLSGLSVPGTKQGLSVVADGKISSLSPSVSYVTGVLGQVADLVEKPGNGEEQAQLLAKTAGFSTPVIYDALYYIKENLKENK